MRPILLLDGYSLLFRAHHALPPMNTKSGEPTSALYGFSSVLLKLLREHRPSGETGNEHRIGVCVPRTLCVVVPGLGESVRLSQALCVGTLRGEAVVPVLKELAEAGNLSPVIDRRYPLSAVPDALRYLGTRHARGKVVINVT